MQNLTPEGVSIQYGPKYKARKGDPRVAPAKNRSRRAARHEKRAGQRINAQTACQ